VRVLGPYCALEWRTYHRPRRLCTR